MRLVSVVMGTESERARKVESKKLLNYGFRFFLKRSPRIKPVKNLPPTAFGWVM